MNFLTLGDGNFSFTLCLVKRILQSGISISTLIATSYDLRDELVLKYPETARILQDLRSILPNIILLHGVDATLDLHHQLSSSLSATPYQASIPEHFDHIFFNFPHLGKENCIDHSSFIAHIMNRVYLLMHPNSQAFFYLALAEAQAERWKL